MRNDAQQQKQRMFNGCCLSLQLNGLNVLAVEKSEDIKAILSFIAQKERKEKEAVNERF